MILAPTRDPVRRLARTPDAAAATRWATSRATRVVTRRGRPGGKVNRAKLRAHLEAHDAIPGALDALDAAWAEWDGLRREERDA